MKTPPNALMVQRYRAGLGFFTHRMMLLLTTTGRKSGKPHTVAVQYERIDGKYYVGAAGGLQSDWLKNIQANSAVTLEIGRKSIQAKAEVILEPEEITRLLELRLKKHPLLVGMILKMDGVGFHPEHEQLMAYSKRLAFAAITPLA